MKTLFSPLVSSVILTLATGATAQALILAPGTPTPPAALQNYINLAESGNLPAPDPLDPNITTLWVAGGRISFIDTVADNGGQYSLFDLYVPPTIGPPLHFHTYENEWFYVVDGAPAFQHENDFIQGESELLLFTPELDLHAFKNTSDQPVRMLLFYEPRPIDRPESVGNIENFFKDSRVGQAVDPNNPNVGPGFNPAELVTAGPDYGLFFPSTFGFVSTEFVGNEVTILRTGFTNEASVDLGISDGTNITVDFGLGEFLKTVTLDPSYSSRKVNLSLSNPSPNSSSNMADNSYIALINDEAVLNSSISTPESSSPIGIIGFGLLVLGLNYRFKQSPKSTHSTSKTNHDRTIHSQYP